MKFKILKTKITNGGHIFQNLTIQKFRKFRKFRIYRITDSNNSPNRNIRTRLSIHAFENNVDL